MRAVGFSPDGNAMATGSGDNTVILWNVANPATPTRTATHRIATLTDYPAAVLSVAFSPDGKTMATGSEQVTIWRLTGP